VRRRDPGPAKLVFVPAIYAHRGLHTSERENTVSAFLAAKELGVDGVELDVRRTSDGELVVHHDPVIGESVIARCTRRELPDHVPSLAQAMDACRGIRVNVEIKNIQHPSEPTYDPTGDFARQVVGSLHDWNWADSVMISSFDLATCAVVRSIDPVIPIGWLIWDVEITSAMTQAHVLGLDAVNPYFSTVTPEAMSLAGELELSVNVWTVNNPTDITAMAALGVASIITDDPKTAMALVR
jgi:glycerophosphoryl diester phosphodiesterase